MAIYPSPLRSGPPYIKFLILQKDYSKITVENVFEDQGVSRNVSAADMPQSWELYYDGLTETQAKVLDDFYATHQLGVVFDFYPPRNVPFTAEGAIQTGCYFTEYERPAHNKYWSNARRVKITKYPS